MVHSQILFQLVKFEKTGNFYTDQISNMLRIPIRNENNSSIPSSFEENESIFLNKKRNFSSVDSEQQKIQKVQIIKNNKVVYTSVQQNKNFLRAKKNLNKLTFISRGQRGSKYRGVSKNGNQWQVLIMIKKSKSYIGSYHTEELAARIYDIISLKNNGTKAKTNFCYSENEIKNLILLNVKDEFIEDKIQNALRLYINE